MRVLWSVSCLIKPVGHSDSWGVGVCDVGGFPPPPPPQGSEEEGQGTRLPGLWHGSLAAAPAAFPMSLRLPQANNRTGILSLLPTSHRPLLTPAKPRADR